LEIKKCTFSYSKNIYERVFSYRYLFLFFFQTALAGDSVTVSAKKLAELEEKIERLQLLPFEKETAVLKDGYSTSITTSIILISAGLALITAIGALLGISGSKNIAEIKKAHQDELDKLKILKTDFETNFKDFNTDFALKQRSFNELIVQLQSGLQKVQSQNQRQETEIEIQD